MQEEAWRKIGEDVNSWGDTVHNTSIPSIFKTGGGSFLWDVKNRKYLDWQMWYSACNFSYGNKFIINALKNQLDELPQLTSLYTHSHKSTFTIAPNLYSTYEERNLSVKLFEKIVRKVPNDIG
jgi:4-aminobutyrate aminotransferase-like enzyme